MDGVKVKIKQRVDVLIIINIIAVCALKLIVSNRAKLDEALQKK
jgi:hypothetical protein